MCVREIVQSAQASRRAPPRLGGCSGAAGTAHPLATLTAIETLKRGGSAVDAAIAANACLGFLEPTSSGVGGDCFALVWDPKLAKVVSLAGSGRSHQGVESRDSASTFQQRRHPAARRRLHFHSRSRRCLVDAA